MACGMVVARTTIIIVSSDRIMNGSHVFRKPPTLREREMKEEQASCMCGQITKFNKECFLTKQVSTDPVNFP